MEDRRADGRFSSRQERLLLRAATAAIGAEFPNTERCGCPEAKAVRRLAQRRIPLPETGELVDHIATCAPCFNQYVRYRRAHQLVHFGGRLLVAAVCLVSAALWWTHRAPTSPAHQQLLTEAPPVTVRTATLDYRETSPTRSAQQDRRSQEAHHLPRAVLNLIILLPFGSEDGSYVVQLRTSHGLAVANAAGDARWSNTAETLITTLDLRTLAPGKYALALRRGNSSWHTYPVVVD